MTSNILIIKMNDYFFFFFSFSNTWTIVSTTHKDYFFVFMQVGERLTKNKSWKGLLEKDYLYETRREKKYMGLP